MLASQLAKMFVVFCVAAALCCGTLIAQDSSAAPQVLSLNDAIRLATENNRTLKIAKL